MADEEKKADITKYPEGLDYLAENLKMPVPKDKIQQRKAIVMGLIVTLARQ